MLARRSFLAIVLLAPGCDRATPPAAVVVKPAAPARKLVKSKLVITCAHVVMDGGLLSGVLTARNVGPEPIALVDRSNSWGAYQWEFMLGPEWAGNPQHSWYANHYSETVLAPGEVRHARFAVARFPDRSRLGWEAWRFVVGDGERQLLHLPDDPAADPPFMRGQEIALRMKGEAPQPLEWGKVAAVALWTGTVTVRSEEVASVQDLDARIRGKALR